MSIRNQEVVYRINKYADFPQESRNFRLDGGIVPVIDWDKVRSYDSVYTLPRSANITGTGSFRCFEVPIGKRYRVKRLSLYTQRVDTKFNGSLYLAVEGNSVHLSASEINGFAYTADPHMFLEFKEPLELRPRSTLSAVVGVFGGTANWIEAKMWGSITNDY